IIPFLLMLKFSRQINESIDYVIYAAVPALGFAFMENVMYFQGSGLQDITGRTLTAVLLHMSMTTIAMYGLFYSRYRKDNKNKLLYFAGSFFAAMVVHGLYDFILICEKVPPELRIFSLLILVLCMSKFSLIIRNALNVSEFNVGQTTRVENLSKYLVYSLSGVILLQYFLMAWKFGAENTNASMLGNIGAFYFIMFIIVAMLGNIKITRSKWMGLFNQNSSADKLDARALKAAAVIGADWHYLKGKYAKWEVLIGVSLLGFSLSIALLYTYIFWRLDHVLHPVEETSKFVFLPSWSIWIIPSLFLGIVTAVLPFMLIFKKLFGNERYKEYEIYDKLKNGPHGKKIFLGLSVMIISVCALIVPLCLDHYVKVHDDGITLSRFAGFGAVDYSYDDVKELRQVVSQKDGSGNITHDYYFEIVFADDYLLTFQNSVFDLDFDEQQDVVKFIEDNCDVRLQIVDPYPVRAG
ncbi:MAG: PrsW family intramembrane metalloprotease, partial [Anaerohalosphaera sp.]|nr:PrsW family intramembrane metalloprotease [Anaerohalosphaera sp.]